MLSWILLLIAAMFETAWAVGLKYTEGFTRPLASGLVIVALVISVFLLGLAVRHIPIGTGYAVWTGLGAAGTAILGIILFNEPRDWPRLACIGLILLGVLGLKLTYVAPTPPAPPSAPMSSNLPTAPTPATAVSASSGPSGASAAGADTRPTSFPRMIGDS